MSYDDAGNYPSLKDVMKRLNNLSRKEINDMTGYDSVDILTRVQLNQFLKDWLVDDNGLGGYLNNIPEDYPKDDALLMGDLLVFMMLGGDKKPFGDRAGQFERPYIQLDGGGFLPIENRWTELLSGVKKKMPEGKSFSDMIGIHAMILFALPQKKYHRYNLEQAFRDNPDLANVYFSKGTTNLSPADYETLNNLRSIVKRGAIQQFRLALGSGTDGLKALSKTGSFGTTLMNAYRIAESAVAFFEKGDFQNAVERLQELQSEYGLGAGAFASNINNIFVGTISTLGVLYKAKNSESYEVELKGKSTPVLMSLDTGFIPEKGPKNMSNAARGAAKVASAPAYAWKSSAKKFLNNEVNDNRKRITSGTNGQKSVESPYTNSGQGNTTPQGNMFTTTDWAAIFAGAYGYGNNLLTGDPNIDVVNKGWEAMFKDERRPILKFLVHGSLDKGLQNLLPTGVLTVSLGKNVSKKYGQLSKNDDRHAMGGYDADLFYESFSPDDDTAEEIASVRATSDAETDDEFDLNKLDAGRARRRGMKRPSKKKPSMGQMIAIDLVPKSQIRLSSVQQKATWFKDKMKKDETKMLQGLWNEYARGAPELTKGRGRNSRKWFWKGKYYDTKEEAKEAYKKASKTYADKKGGKANMTMIYAKRKDNDEYVPFRIFIPKILVRKRADKILPKKGGSYEAVKMLLDAIETDFGEITFKRTQATQGGFDLEKGSKTVSVDRGVHHIFQTEGLSMEDWPYSTNARPSRVRNDGSLVYQAMTHSGTSVEMGVAQ